MNNILKELLKETSNFRLLIDERPSMRREGEIWLEVEYRAQSGIIHKRLTSVCDSPLGPVRQRGAWHLISNLD